MPLFLNDFLHYVELLLFVFIRCYCIICKCGAAVICVSGNLYKQLFNEIEAKRKVVFFCKITGACLGVNAYVIIYCKFSLYVPLIWINWGNIIDKHQTLDTSLMLISQSELFLQLYFLNYLILGHVWIRAMLFYSVFHFGHRMKSKWNRLLPFWIFIWWNITCIFLGLHSL